MFTSLWADKTQLVMLLQSAQSTTETTDLYGCFGADTACVGLCLPGQLVSQPIKQHAAPNIARDIVLTLSGELILGQTTLCTKTNLLLGKLVLVQRFT